MSRALFVNGNLHGHINPTLPVVAELVNLGEEVWYFCAKAFEEQVTAAGAHFIDSGENLERFMQSYKSTGNHPFYSLLEYIIRYDGAMLPELMRCIEGRLFDYIIYDSILGGGYFLKHLFSIPVICSNSSFAMSKLPVPERMMVPGFHPELDYFYEVLQQECEKWKVPVPGGYEIFVSKGDLNLVYTTEEFNSEGETFDESYRFCGPTAGGEVSKQEVPEDRIDNEVITDTRDSLINKEVVLKTQEIQAHELMDQFFKGEVKQLIYISLGSINTDFNQFYRTCISAFRETKYNVILSVGRKCNIETLGDIPENILVRQFVPQVEILKKATLFISHGGFNSISEALTFGVPIIVIPMVNDQFMVAKHLIRTGAGISMTMADITEESLLVGVERVLSDQSFKDAATRLSIGFKAAGGAKMAADEVLKFVKNR